MAIKKSKLKWKVMWHVSKSQQTVNHHGTAAVVLQSLQWGAQTAGITVCFNPSVHLCTIRSRHLDCAGSHSLPVTHTFSFVFLFTFWPRQLAYISWEEYSQLMWIVVWVLWNIQKIWNTCHMGQPVLTRCCQTLTICHASLTIQAQF